MASWRTAVISPVHLATIDPAQDWARAAGLDDPLPAAEILGKVVEDFSRSHVGTAVKGGTEVLLKELHSLLARGLRIQAEMRPFPQDLELLDHMAREATLVSQGVGSYTVDVPSNWFDRLDHALHTWTCQKCGSVVPGIEHGVDECNEALTERIMEE